MIKNSKNYRTTANANSRKRKSTIKKHANFYGSLTDQGIKGKTGIKTNSSSFFDFLLKFISKHVFHPISYKLTKKEQSKKLNTSKVAYSNSYQKFWNLQIFSVLFLVIVIVLIYLISKI